MILKEEWSLTRVVLQQGFHWCLYRGGLSSGVLLAPIQGWSLIRVLFLLYRGGLSSGWSHKGFYWLLYRGGLLSGYGGLSPGILLALIQGCFEVLTGSCTGVVFHWGGLLHQGFYWLLHRGGLSSGWSSIRVFTGSSTGVVSSIRYFTGSCSGVVFHWGGFSYGSSSIRGFTGSCTVVVFYWLQCKGGFSSGILLDPVYGWFLIRVVSHQGFYWFLYRGGPFVRFYWLQCRGGFSSGVLLVLVQEWPFIRFYWLQCKGVFSSGILLAPVQGCFSSVILLAPVQGCFSSGILLAPVQGWFHTWVIFHGFFYWPLCWLPLSPAL